MNQKGLVSLRGHSFDIISLSKPQSTQSAVEMIKIISKLSSIVGNLIELHLVEVLNKQQKSITGHWERQDPGFPDAVFKCNLSPNPGFEIKAWYPFATEITARFKDSQNFFSHDQTDVVMPAWVPENLYYGKPKLIDIVVVSGISVAKARDKHYFNPPDYLVIEPEDTSNRTINLQQTNTSGYKIQVPKGSNDYMKAETRAKQLGLLKGQYSPQQAYQNKVRKLFGEFNYRLDTNYAKMDRIVHPGLEKFKNSVMRQKIFGSSIGDWKKILKGSDSDIQKAITKIP